MVKFMTKDKPSLMQQENALSLLAHSDKYGKLVVDTVDPSLFEGDYREVAERCVGYWKQHGQAPKVHTYDLFADILEDSKNRRASTFRSILADMSQLSEDINADYVIRELSAFVRIQMLKDSIIQAAERLQKPTQTTIQEVEGLLSGILTARDFRLDAGMKIGDVERLMTFLRAQEGEFSTGIAEFDKRNIVPYREAVMLLLGGKGRGKSWWLVNLGKRALQRRKKVLHIALEDGEERTTQRYLQSLFAIPKREAELKMTTKLETDVDRWGKRELVGLEKERPPIDFSFDSPDVNSELTARLTMLGPRVDDLIIKGFPSGTLTIDELDGYMDSLAMTDGFIPDLLVLDYIGITRTDPKDKRGSLGNNMVQFKALCKKRGVAGATAHQIGRDGFDSKQARSTHVAEDWSLIHTADITITHSATSSEQRHGLGRLFVDHAKSEADKFGVLVTQNYSIGQYVLDSMPLPDEYFDFLETIKDDPEPEEAEDD